MASNKMRKDQIYLTEKSADTGIQIDYLAGFDDNLKDSSPFAKWYNESRLGAIPAIHYRDIADTFKGVDLKT